MLFLHLNSSDVCPFSTPPSSVSDDDEDDDVVNGSDAELLLKDDREPFLFVLPEAAVPSDDESDLACTFDTLLSEHLLAKL